MGLSYPYGRMIRLSSHVLVLVCLLAPAAARAQTLSKSVALTLGTGIELGNGQGREVVVLRSPLFMDAAIRTWTDETPDLVMGGSIRVEVDRTTSVAGVPRVEINRRFGSLLLRPGIGVPIFFAPFSMVGVELSVGVVLSLGDGLSLVGGILIDAFFFGSDIPQGSSVVMFNGALGVELDL